MTTSTHMCPLVLGLSCCAPLQTVCGVSLLDRWSDRHLPLDFDALVERCMWSSNGHGIGHAVQVYNGDYMNHAVLFTVVGLRDDSAAAGEERYTVRFVLRSYLGSGSASSRLLAAANGSGQCRSTASDQCIRIACLIVLDRLHFMCAQTFNSRDWNQCFDNSSSMCASTPA